MGKIKTIEVGASIFEENDAIAAENRLMLRGHGVTVLNLMGSPGSGKTAVLEKTVSRLKNDHSFAVIEGDIKGSLDSERLAGFDIPVVQINTGGACHLDAAMVRKALEGLPLQEIEILFIENVGNLVCPAEFKIGEDRNIVVSSVTEGEEKPLKYPLVFRISDLCLLNKIDLASHAGFNPEIFSENIRSVSPGLQTICFSAKYDRGFDEWTGFIRESFSARVSAGKEEEGLRSLFGEIFKNRTVIVGLGDRMKGDDGAGCEFAGRLADKLSAENVRVINAENRIENCLGEIERFAPQLIIVFDALHFGSSPGRLKLVELEDLRDATSSTHTFSLPLMFSHVVSQTGAVCRVVGIQPGRLDCPDTLSPEIRVAIDRFVNDIIDFSGEKGE